MSHPPVTGHATRSVPRGLTYRSVQRRRLEIRHGRPGTLEYTQVLRLLEKHSIRRVAASIEKALVTGAPQPDVVAMYLYPDLRIELATFVLADRPHLRAEQIAPT